jgi:hypothetical protein
MTEIPDDLVERMAREAGKPLANMTGGCFMPDNGRSARGECGDGDCYCTRVQRHVVNYALTELLRTHDIVERIAARPEILLNDDGTLDEIVAENAVFHIEQMDTNAWHFSVEACGEQVDVWLSARGKINATFERTGAQLVENDNG